MERKNYSKLLMTAFCTMFAVMNLLSQAPPVTTVGTATSSAGTMIVPVTVSGFNNVGALSMTLLYDPAKLEYAGATVNSGLTPGSVVITPVSDQSGTFKLSYFQSTAIVLAAPANTLFSLTFVPKPNLWGVTVPLTWSTLQGDCDVTPPSPGSFTPPITVQNMSTYFINGSLTIPAVSGPGRACTGSTGNVYTGKPGMTAYSWTVSNGGTIVGSSTGSTVNVSWNTSGTQTVSLAYIDPVNGASTSDYNVEVYLPVPTITGPLDPVTNMPATIGNGITTGQVYTTEPGMTNYAWTTSAAGTITAGQGTNSITVTWTNPNGQQSVAVNYTDPLGCRAVDPSVLIINYFPFLPPIDPLTIPQFVDPLPHFAAGLRVDAKTVSSLIIKAVPVQQVALSTGTVLGNGTIGSALTPNAGKGNYAAYGISKDNGQTWGIPMWPAQTIETTVNHPLTVQYQNDLFNINYNHFNILADQTLLMNGYPQNGNIYTEPYLGPIPMVVHLHGGEMPSDSDGGPTAWFMPGNTQYGPGFQFNASSLASYPNMQEAGTLWFHPHDQGLTRINVYTGLAGFYFLRGDDEEAAKLPGWTGDDKVREVTPAGRTATFNGTNAYLPEIEIAIQDRMFNTNGELYWPVTPPNPDIHPFWSPEFFGDIFTVNGKSWPYLSVAPRRYRFRMLDGCNARFLNMWLESNTVGVNAPAITVVGSDGAFLDAPVVLDPATKTLLMAPGERYDVIIDFTGIPAGTVFTLKNNANIPFPDGDPVVPGLTDRIMQFVVNGQLVSAADPSNPGTDKSLLPANIRPVNPMVKLTNFAGGLTTGVVPDVKRQIILNEVSGAGGPVQALFNNSHFDGAVPILGAPLEFGGPTETPLEGTTELVQIINTTVDAHPIHIHLTQWQLVSRQMFDINAYLAAYSAAWAPRGVPEFPAGQGYPGGGGSPLPYDVPNDDGALGGNPAITPFLIPGTLVAADPQEMVWKDDVKAIPGEVTTYIVRYAPTDRPINATPDQLLYPFDPSLGPGYVWHCHIIDHEDMDMMRPLMIQPSALRFPQITTQPVPKVACVGDAASFSVVATSQTTISYIWQVSSDAGVTWADLANNAVYSGVTTSTLNVVPAVVLSGNRYRCKLTNIDGLTISNAALLTVNNCSVSGTLKYNNSLLDPVSGFRVTINGKSALTNGSGAFTVTGVTSGIHQVTVDHLGKNTGAINSSDAGAANYWFVNPSMIPYCRYMAGDVNNDQSITAADAQRIQRYFVLNQVFDRTAWQYHRWDGTCVTNPPAFTVEINGSGINGFDIHCVGTGDFNGSFLPNAAAKGLGVTPNMKMISGSSMKVVAGRSFDLPVKAVSEMEVGAVSLILNLTSDITEVENVTVSGSNVPAIFNYEGTQLRISWYSLTPVKVKADEDLMILKLRTGTSFKDGKSMEITMEEDLLNEIADPTFKVIDGVTLKTAIAVGTSDLKGEFTGSELLLTLFPNPVTDKLTFNYSLPVDGEVTIQVYNSIGSLAGTILRQSKTRGSYTLVYDAATLPRGVYFAKILLKGKSPDMIRTVRFVVNK